MSGEPKITIGEWREPQHTYSVAIAYVPDYESGGYTVFAFQLPGATSEGDTIDDAREAIREAAAGVIESYLQHGETIPWDFGALPPKGWCKAERICVECKLSG